MVANEELVTGAREGDNKSFELLYQSIYADMYRYAVYMLSNEDDAKDAVSDAICDIYKGIAGLRDSKSFVPWVLRILNIKCLNKRKEYSIKNNFFVSNDSNETSELSDEKSMDDFEQIHMNMELKRVMGILDIDEKSIIIMKAVYGYNSREIGKILDIKHQTVRSKYKRAIDKLKERM